MLTLRLKAGSTHILSFNEPDLDTESNLTPGEAASGYMTYIQPYASQAQLGTPAVTNGPAPMGLAWLSDFLTDLENLGGTYDFCPIHWYATTNDVTYFQEYMAQASQTCGKPIWITEFGATGTEDEQNTFLQTVLPWLDAQSYVERYAWFMVAEDNLISTGTSLSTIGVTFATYT
jgi:hypothetical protein